MIYEYLGITFASWQLFIFFPIIIIGCCIAVWWCKRRINVASILTVKFTHNELLKYFSYRRSIIRAILYCISLCLLFIALLQPQFGEKDISIEQEGRELFIALDISRSMLAADVKPDRLVFAKSKIKQLLQLLPAERIGLVIFSGSALIHCPLTRDKSAFNLFLDYVDVDTISSSTTSLAGAINTVINNFSSQSARKNKLLVIFTDGEDFSSNLNEVREHANRIGLKIFTYGVGTAAGAPVPILNDEGERINYEKDAQGTIIFSKLNEGILKSVSSESGAVYISPTQNNDDLKKLVSYIEKYEKEKFENKELSQKEDKYPYCAAVALGALLLEWIL